MQQKKSSNSTSNSRNKRQKQAHCLICFSPLFFHFDFESIFSSQRYICLECQKKFKMADTYSKINNILIHYLYYYNQFMQKLIYQYKGCYDIELAPVFLDYFLSKLKKEYKGYTVVLPPSSKEDNKERGFIHLEEIISYLGLPIIHIFTKTTNIKQSSLHFTEREQIKKYIVIDNTNLANKKILLFDDIYTSGNTIKTCLDLLIRNKASKRNIKVLILAKTEEKST